jgi:gamma-glutamyltranspeptidase/glutathione hydrolase
MRALRTAAATALLLMGACAQQAPAPPPAALAQQPEAATASTPKPGWSAQRYMVAAAHPLAVDAGYEVLREGGTAVDAAVAVQMVLGLVEPQSSGLGGGAFLMLWDGRAVQAWDGRETAPAAADEQMFLGPDGKPVPHAEATLGGRAVATPGALKMLEAVHQLHGRLPWARVLQPAIALAEGGFPMGERLHALLQGERDLPRDRKARAYFYGADGSPQPVGHLMRNPAYAALLRAIAARGSEAFYRGASAAELVRRVLDSDQPGRLREDDLLAYEALQREPLCAVWLQIYRVCGMPPPSSGQLAIMQTLGVLEQLRIAAPTGAVPGPDWLHAYTGAAQLAYADRAQHVADPDFTPAPAGRWDSLLDPGYLAGRAALVGPRAMAVAPAGRPGGQALSHAPMPDQPEHGTSHVSVVDGEGRAVALTTSIEAAFGSQIMADGGTGLPGGYLLNNEMTDFSLAPADAQGRPVANRIQGGKRPRSSMSPTLVFDARDGRFLATLGSPGGPFIIHFTARTLVAALQSGLGPQRAIDGPNFGSLGGPLLLEAGRFPASTIEALRGRGHRVVEVALPSGLQMVQRAPGGGWIGGADPRREGTARGD